MNARNIKVTIGDKTFWHQMIKDGVATIVTADEELKKMLFVMHQRFPDAVHLMYDGEDLCAADFEGTTTFFLDAKNVELFIKPGLDIVGIRVYEDNPDCEVVYHEDGEVI